MATEKYRKKMRFGPARTRGRLNPGTSKTARAHGSRGRQSFVHTVMPPFVETKGPYTSSNYNFRFLWDVDRNLFTPVVNFIPNQIRFQIYSRGNGPSEIDSFYIGYPDTFPNFSDTPVQVTFNGGEQSVEVPADSYMWSDWINFSFDGTQDLMTAHHVNDGSLLGSLFTINKYPFAAQQQVKIGPDESHLQYVSGYGNGPANYYQLINQIEVRRVSEVPGELSDLFEEYNNGYVIYDTTPYRSQSFTGQGGKLDFVDVLLQKSGSGSRQDPVKAHIYSHTGTFGTNSEPDELLATSYTAIPLDDITSDSGGEWKRFHFGGSITLEGGVNYCLVLEFDYPSPYVLWLFHSAGTHGGNMASSSNGSDWSAQGSYDACFRVWEKKPQLEDYFEGHDTNWNFNSDPNQYRYQSFTGKGGKLSAVEVLLCRVGSTAGVITPYIYSHTGTFGSTGKPGLLLATGETRLQNELDVSPNYQWMKFYFTGTDRIILENGTHYCLVIHYNDSPVEYIVWRVSSSGGHEGNAGVSESFPLFISVSGYDGTFRIYEEK